MLNRFRSLVNALNSPDDILDGSGPGVKPPKFPYRRPLFLELPPDVVAVYSDQKVRPVLHSTFSALPHNSGYAECINAGKSRFNEDQAVCLRGVLLCTSEADRTVFVPYTYFALFDGHGGTGASLAAANQLHHLLQEKLVDTQDYLLGPNLYSCAKEQGISPMELQQKLIKGALEAAFKEMDQMLLADRERYAPAGGTTALVALFILNKVHIANAGDSRAVLYTESTVKKKTNDFSPSYDKKRILKVARDQPSLINNEFTFLEYNKQPTVSDLGKRIMYRTPSMEGWAFKTATRDDLKQSIVQGTDRKSRILGTLGVARGFGDYDLRGGCFRLLIKPFLTCIPEVVTVDLLDTSRDSLLIMGTDGLWDDVDDNEVVHCVNKVEEFNDSQKYVCIATCLVAAAKGTIENNHWIGKNGKYASVDDISVFVIPLEPFKEEFVQLKLDYVHD